MEFKDMDSLMAEIEIDMKDIVRDVGVNILELMRDSVTENVYLAWSPQEYERSPSGKGFLASWEDEEIINDPMELSILVHSNPLKMVYNPEKFQHGNAWSDRRSYMDEAIQEGYGYDFMNAYDEFPRDYFFPVIDELDSGRFDILVMQKLHHYGIDDYQYRKI